MSHRGETKTNKIIRHEHVGMPNDGGGLDAARLLGVVQVPQGGTGLAEVEQGDLLHGAAGNTLARLPKSAVESQYLSNQGTNNDPAWEPIDLDTGVFDELKASNGGTGDDLSAADGFVKANATEVMSVVGYTGTGDVVRAIEPVIDTPDIDDFTNANHTHQNAAGGGQLNAGSVFNAGLVPVGYGGTGIDFTQGQAGILAVSGGIFSATGTIPDSYILTPPVPYIRTATPGAPNYGPVYELTVPDASIFTGVGTTPVLTTQANGDLYLARAAGSRNLVSEEVDGTGEWTVTIAFIPDFRDGQTQTQLAGIVVRDNAATPKLVTFSLGITTAFPYGYITTVKWTNRTTVNGAYVSVGRPILGLSFLRVTLDSTNLTFYYSVDGLQWIQHDQRAKGDFLGAITNVGFFVDNANTSYAVGMALKSWSKV